MTRRDALRIELPFSEEDARAAYEAWGANCGPTALAAVLGMPLEGVRVAVEASGFAERRYMSPTMMKASLGHLGVKWKDRRPGPFDLGGLAFPRRGLVRVQWGGPWTAPGANPKWAYLHTHWIASWKSIAGDQTATDVVWSELSPVIFDVNGGLMELERWEDEIVPLITASISRADGEYSVTHSWEVDAETRTPKFKTIQEALESLDDR